MCSIDFFQGGTYNGVIGEMAGLWEKWNRDAEGGNGSVQLSSCAYHSDEPLRAKIVFSNGFHDF